MAMEIALYTMYSQWGAIETDAGDAPATMCFENQSTFGKPQTAQIDSVKALELFSIELQQAIENKKSKDGLLNPPTYRPLPGAPEA